MKWSQWSQDFVAPAQLQLHPFQNFLAPAQLWLHINKKNLAPAQLSSRSWSQLHGTRSQEPNISNPGIKIKFVRRW